MGIVEADRIPRWYRTGHLILTVDAGHDGRQVQRLFDLRHPAGATWRVIMFFLRERMSGACGARGAIWATASGARRVVIKRGARLLPACG